MGRADVDLKQKLSIASETTNSNGEMLNEAIKVYKKIARVIKRSVIAKGSSEWTKDPHHIGSRHDIQGVLRFMTFSNVIITLFSNHCSKTRTNHFHVRNNERR